MDFESSAALSNGSGDRPWLITPSDRVRFTSLYVAATILASLIAQYLWAIPLARLSPSTVLLFIQGFLTGSTIGFAQWWILRRYLPTWHWIGATALGQVVITVANDAWLSYVLEQQSSQPQTMLELFAGNSMSLPLMLIATLPIALLQWLILRRYTAAAQWWLITPVVFGLLAFGFLLLSPSLLQRASLPVRFAWPILMPGLTGVIQAIALCLFRTQRGIALESTAAAAGDRQAQSVWFLAVVALGIVSTLAALVGSAEILLLQLQMNYR